MKLPKVLRTRTLIPIFGVVFSAFLMMLGIWQLDLICSGPVWTPGWCQPSDHRFSDKPFECWYWYTTIGQAYNVFLFVIFISFWLTLISAVVLGISVYKIRQEE